MKRQLALIALALALALALAAPAAQAQFVTGNDLYNDMTSSESGRRGAAYGFLAGVHDAYDGTAFCSPSAVTLGQVRDVVHKALATRPEGRHLPAWMIVRVVLTKTWPCAKGSNNKGDTQL